MSTDTVTYVSEALLVSHRQGQNFRNYLPVDMASRPKRRESFYKFCSYLSENTGSAHYKD
jgi:hypothetical protein